MTTINDIIKQQKVEAGLLINSFNKSKERFLSEYGDKVIASLNTAEFNALIKLCGVSLNDVLEKVSTINEGIYVNISLLTIRELIDLSK